MTTLTARLTVNEAALARNWRALDALSAPDCETAAVVKGDGYGCGLTRVGQCLASAGVRSFFVALPEEGVSLRAALGPDPAIYILGGYGRDLADQYRASSMRPVLNSADQFQTWFTDIGGPCALQLDTGMNRLGMEADEATALGDLPDAVELVMSHMGCADDPPHPMNKAQLTEFRRLTESLHQRLSLSATAGTLLSADYHFDMVRPGIGLYGGWPYAEAERVVTVEVPIIQIRDLAPGESVGYAATWTATRPSRIATISAGYADGLIRALSGGAQAFIDGQPVPFAGRVSMDLITLDVTDCPCVPGDMVELLGPNQSIDDLAAAAGTIGHEILTSLGRRYARH
ncbi:MAG: alanine racemase [Pseudomonadota bacterium]